MCIRMFDWKFSSTNRLLSFDRTKYNQTFSKAKQRLDELTSNVNTLSPKLRVIIALEDVTSIEITHIFLTGLRFCEPLNGYCREVIVIVTSSLGQALMVKHLRNNSVAGTIAWHRMQGHNYEK